MLPLPGQAQFELTQLPVPNTLGRPELLNYGRFNPYQDIYHPTDYVVQISPDGKRFLSLASTGLLTVYEMGKGRIAHAMGRLPPGKGSGLIAQAIGQAATPVCAAFSPDGRYVAMGTAEGVGFVWDLTTPFEEDNPIAQLMGINASDTLLGHSGPIKSIWFSPDGQQLLTGSHDATIRLWQRTGGELLRTLKTGSKVSACCFSPDGQRVVVGTERGDVLVYETLTSKLLHTLKGHTKAVRAVACHATGEVLSGGDDNTVRRWNAATGKLIHTYLWHKGSVTQVAYVGEALLFVTLGDDTSLNLWEMNDDDEPIQRLPPLASPYISGSSGNGILILLSRPANLYTLYKIHP